MRNLLQHYVQMWNLIPDGNSFTTHSSILQPVECKGMKMMLKIPFEGDERRGLKLMAAWNGMGVPKVFEWDENAILMERLTGELSLKTMVAEGRDDEATRIICDVANLLHANKKVLSFDPVPLAVWFNDLFLFAGKYGGVFVECMDLVSCLLGNQQNTVILHGDLHHENVLQSSSGSWLAIDPKGLVGENTFDYVNVLCNPEQHIALAEGRLIKQIDVISRSVNISQRHLLKWTAAWAGLSAVWFLNDNLDASLPFEIAKMALALLRNG